MTLLRNIGVAILGLIIGGGAVYGGVYSNVTKDFSEGVSVDGTVVVDGSRNITGVAGTFSSTLGVSGLITADAGTLKSNTNSTSTPASMTLAVSDVAGYDTVIVNPTGAAAAKTLTFFASSSASTWLPTAGDRQDTCFINATGTAATTLIFAAGTGIDLEVATSSADVGGAFDLTISAGGMGCFTFVRDAATAAAFDIHAGLVEFSNGD